MTKLLRNKALSFVQSTKFAAELQHCLEIFDKVKYLEGKVAVLLRSSQSLKALDALVSDITNDKDFLTLAKDLVVKVRPRGEQRKVWLKLMEILCEDLSTEKRFVSDSSLIFNLTRESSNLLTIEDIIEASSAEYSPNDLKPFVLERLEANEKCIANLNEETFHLSCIINEVQQLLSNEQAAHVDLFKDILKDKVAQLLLT